MTPEACGADRQRRLQTLRQPLRACDPKQMRAIDVQYVQGQRHLRDPLSLGDELLGKDRGATASKTWIASNATDWSRPSRPGG